MKKSELKKALWAIQEMNSSLDRQKNILPIYILLLNTTSEAIKEQYQLLKEGLDSAEKAIILLVESNTKIKEKGKYKK